MVTTIRVLYFFKLKGGKNYVTIIGKRSCEKTDGKERNYAAVQTESKHVQLFSVTLEGIYMMKRSIVFDAFKVGFGLTVGVNLGLLVSKFVLNSVVKTLDPDENEEKTEETE